MNLPLTTDPDPDPDGSKDRPCIYLSTKCFMYPGKQSQKIQKNNNLRKKWLKTNIPQSVELDYPRAVAL
jgi:hypothetical protein